MGPYRPSVDGRTLAHVQLPTTLPTLDELIGNDGIDEQNVAKALLARTDGDVDQVFTLHAELEGGLLLPAFESLLSGWQAQGHELVSLATLRSHVRQESLPIVPLTWGTVPGRSGSLIVAVQS
jgi:hypothetical protein